LEFGVEAFVVGELVANSGGVVGPPFGTGVDVEGSCIVGAVVTGCEPVSTGVDGAAVGVLGDDVLSASPPAVGVDTSSWWGAGASVSIRIVGLKVRKLSSIVYNGEGAGVDRLDGGKVVPIESLWGRGEAPPALADSSLLTNRNAKTTPAMRNQKIQQLVMM
jgi:hypothetical protein